MNQGLRGWPMPAPPMVPYINIQDQKAQNTAGGAFTSGADQTRILNTVVSDSAGIARLSSNQVTLPAGTYRFAITAPAYSVDQHQVLLYNVTDAVVVQRGTSVYAPASSSVNISSVSGRMTISSTKTFEVRHRCLTTKTTDGLGVAGNFGTEVYTVLELWKEG